jgi:xylan 1,4-beta-xylosidase
MVKVDFSRKAGKIKPLHGINNGPLSSECVTDTSKYYKEIGIPFVRLHDTDWPSFKLV